MKRRIALNLLAGLFLLTFACSSDGNKKGPAIEHPPVNAPTTCNPIAEEWDCLFPYPSDHFVVADSTTPTGMRVVIPIEAQPHSHTGDAVDLHAKYPADGFSQIPAIQVAFPVRPAEDQLLSPDDDLSSSTDTTANTIVIDVETNEPVLHFSEVPAGTGMRHMLAIRPLRPLRPGARHVVAIRNLIDRDNQPIALPKGFAALRQGDLSPVHPLAALSARYERDIFPVLKANGVDRDDLLLAWDFTARSEESLTRDAVTIRNDVLAKLKVNPPKITIENVTDDVDEYIARRIDATMEVPLYTESNESGAALHRDEQGNVSAKGSASVPFIVLIPQSVMNGSAAHPARILQFGHGFFGSREEAADEYVASFANETGMIVVACDWWGMSVPDRETLIVQLVEAPEEGMNFTQRAHQGFANFLALASVAQTTLPTLDELTDGDGLSTMDPSQVYFYGISQGHILGGVYMALSPIIEQVALSVGGGGFSILIPRAEPFIAFRALLVGAMEGRIDVERYLSMAITAMDRIDGISYRRLVFDAPLEGSPAQRRVLMHVGIGDTQVPNLGSHAHARALGLKLLQPSPRTLAGFEPAESPLEGSAMVEFDFGIEDPNAIPEGFTFDNGVHNKVRRLPSAIEQLNLFFQPQGPIVHTCEGPCDPE